MRVSEYFKLDKTQPYLDFVDIRLDTDIPVFLDPSAIKNLDSEWGNELSSYLQTFFESVLKKIQNNDHTAAKKLLASLNERNEYHLGYSVGKSRGHGFGVDSAASVWHALTKSKAATTGLLKDLEDTALMINGIGTDMISDATSNILRAPLIKYTQEISKYYGIPLTPNVPSGPIWNPHKEIWEQAFVDLPMTDAGKIILVPKIIVRHKITYQAEEYYRHYLLPEMQDENIKKHTALVETLKNGRLRVTKKALMNKYGKDKLAITEQTIKHPQVLLDYKESKLESPSKPLSHEEFYELDKTEKPNLTALYNELLAIPTGNDAASAYENIIEKIFTALFYPSLCNPTKQHKIHEGRKRIDITYVNESKAGFFYWLSLHYTCPKIFIECKNYGGDIKNPEIDQLSGRFSPSRGKVGILVCRKIKDKKNLYLRCRDTANDQRGYILTIDDDDIFTLITEFMTDSSAQQFTKLRELMNNLVD